MIQNNVLFIPYESHADAVIEYYGTINADGSVLNGSRGIKVTKGAAGLYTLALEDTVPTYLADLANTDMSAKANGTGVTKTCVCTVFPISTGVSASNTISVAHAGKPILSNSGSVSFNVMTSRIPSTGGTPVATNNTFSFKIVVSTMISEAK